MCTLLLCIASLIPYDIINSFCRQTEQARTKTKLVLSKTSLGGLREKVKSSQNYLDGKKQKKKQLKETQVMNYKERSTTLCYIAVHYTSLNLLQCLCSMGQCWTSRTKEPQNYTSIEKKIGQRLGEKTLNENMR